MKQQFAVPEVVMTIGHIVAVLQRVSIARSVDRCNIQRNSVHPSVTFRCFVQTNEDTIMRFLASGRTVILVSEELKFIWIFPGITPSEGNKVKHPQSLGKI